MSLINSSQNFRLTQYNLEDFFTLFISRISPHSFSQIIHDIYTRIYFELYKIIPNTSQFSKVMWLDLRENRLPKCSLFYSFEGEKGYSIFYSRMYIFRAV
jgi:hypothetical protein